tara:strand:- start:540 stop:752 length:213 start_codon:yes stop_codon:yes gene_type:complete
MGDREYYDDALGSFNLDKPDWSESTRADLEKALLETGAWEKDEAAEYSLPRLQAVCLWLMEGRYDEEGGE